MRWGRKKCSINHVDELYTDQPRTWPQRHQGTQDFQAEAKLVTIMAERRGWATTA
jgi:hypothetical protein